LRTEYAGDGLQAGLQRLGTEWETARTVREGLSDAGSVASGGSSTAPPVMTHLKSLIPDMLTF
jgi:hypothetical protein